MRPRPFRPCRSIVRWAACPEHEADFFRSGIHQQQEGATIGSDRIRLTAFLGGNGITNAQALSVGSAPVVFRHLAPIRRQPCDILRPIPIDMVAAKKRGCRKIERLTRNFTKFRTNFTKDRLFESRPIDPVDLIVLTIGVVVAALCAAKFIARNDHRNPERQ